MKKIVFALSCFFIFVPGVSAQAEGDQVLKVATIERHPFVIQTEQGLDGFSIELWEKIAQYNDWQYEFIVKEKFVNLLAAPRIGEADAAIANISITADREEVMDFSSPIYNGGMLIMSSTQSQAKNLFKAISNAEFWWIMLWILLLFVVLGGLLYAFVYKGQLQNKKLFSIYWKLATLGSFGEELPIKPAGRVIFLLWIAVLFFGFIAATAELTSSLVILEQKAKISTVEDLRGKKVGVIGGSTSEAFLRKQNLATITYSSIDNLFDGVANGQLDAVVHDAPIIKFYASNKGAGKVQVMGELFNPENYGVALPSGSLLLEDINQALLRVRENGEYDALHKKWFR